MKRTTFIWACLALFATVTLKATNPIPKKVIEFIPNAVLLTTMNVDEQLLEIKTEGMLAEERDWIIYNKDRSYVSRVTTSTAINVIKTDELVPGEYVLMIKDKEERMLLSEFVIN